MHKLLNWHDKPGAGVEKNAPKKTGIALLGQIVWREAWELFKLNLLIVLASLPLVTIPAAHVAATHVARKMIDDENIYLWREFWGAFRLFFVRATLAGIVSAAVLGGAAYSTYIWFQMAAHLPWALMPLAVSAGVTLFALMVAVHLFVLIQADEVPLVVLLKRAFIGALIRPLPVLAGICFVGVLWLVHILAYPISLFMPAVMNFSLGVLVLTFCVSESARTGDGRGAHIEKP